VVLEISFFFRPHKPTYDDDDEEEDDDGDGLTIWK